MNEKKHFEPGDDASEFGLDDLRAIIAGVRDMVRPGVVAPLEWVGDSINLARDEGFWARLSGAANPYGMTEQFGDAGGEWSDFIRRCEDCAYEVNNQEALDNKIIWLQPGAPGEYVGQWIALGTAHPPPACPITVRLLSCDGSPIAGATVTIDDAPLRIPPRTPIVGTTDADGKYTLPDNTPSGTNLRNTYTISYDGTSLFQLIPFPAMSVYYCDHTLDYCYQSASFTVTITGGGTVGGDTNTFPFTPGTPSGGVTEYTNKGIRLCSQPSSLPAGIHIHAVPDDPENYLDNCTGFTIGCNEHRDVTLDLHYFGDCFMRGQPLMGLGCHCADKGCEFGPGPNGRGLFSKKFQARFTSLPIGPSSATATNPLYFADDEELWIDLTYNPTTGVWDSGCRAGRGNFQSLKNTITGITCTLNQVQAGEFARINYGSTRVVMGCSGITYTRYGTADCTVRSTCDNLYLGGPTLPNSGGNCSCGVQNDGTLCRTCVHQALLSQGGGLTNAQICSPADFTVIGHFFSPLTNDWMVEIRETC